MADGERDPGADRDGAAVRRIERLFWRDIWDSVPAAAAAEHGIERRDFGPVQASLVTDLPRVGMLNLIFGATDPGAIASGRLGAAVEWMRSRGVAPSVSVTPRREHTAAAESWLTVNGFVPGRAWMKFVRDPHPPRFSAPADIDVVELGAAGQEPFGMIAATGFGMPSWAAAFFAELPGREGWRCYVALVDGEAQACGAMLIDDGVAAFGVGATLEPARRRGCQLALLHRRITDAGRAGCQTLFVETGERVEDRPAGSYRNILRAGFKEAYPCPNWRLADG